MNSSNSFKSKLSRRMKKYSHMLLRETGVLQAHFSKYVMVCNAGLVSGIKRETIVNVFSNYSIQQVVMIPGKSYCFIEFSNENICSRAVNDIHGKLVLSEVKGPLYLLMVDTLPSGSAVNFCRQPDGLLIIRDFITREEELLLLQFANKEIENSETIGNNLKHRVVRHYGYAFDYKTNRADKMASCKPIPEQLNFILQRIKTVDDKLKNWIPDQLTMNVYQPGQGIPPHIDTHSAFENIILSLSIGSDVVMDFKNPEGSQFSCLLHRGSLLLMADESRYGWTHGIAPRKYDTIVCDSGLTTQDRKTRISFTFRRTLDNYSCSCIYGALCDSQKPEKTDPSLNIDNTIASELERIHVHEVYNKIANHFSETRHKPWPNVYEFVKSFDVGSIFVDIGCGNGKYLGLNSNLFQIGCDRTEKFAVECNQKGYEAVVCDCLRLPFRPNAVDCCICVAVIHHLSTEERRIAAVKEIARILRPRGKALVYVWAKNQRQGENSSNYLRQRNRNERNVAEADLESGSYSVHLQKSVNDKVSLPVHVNRTEFKHEDVFVPWKMKTDKKDTAAADATVFLRYYHVFDEGELENLCGKVESVGIVKRYYDQGNWCVILEKIS